MDSGCGGKVDQWAMRALHNLMIDAEFPIEGELAIRGSAHSLPT